MSNKPKKQAAGPASIEEQAENLAKKEMHLQKNTGCGAFHRSKTACVWKIIPLGGGMYTMTKVEMCEEDAHAWVKQTIKKRLCQGLPVRMQWKTDLCNLTLKNGVCPFKDCEYAHSLDEVQDVLRHRKYRSMECSTYYMTGTCDYGPNCRFIHNTDPDIFLYKTFTAAEFYTVVKENL